MARKTNWPPRRLFHKASGREFVCWKGRNYYLGKPGTRQADKAYQDLLERLKPEREAADQERAKPRPETLLVVHVVDRWFREGCQRYSPDSREPQAFRFSLAPMLTLFGHLPADEFDQLHLEQVQLAMARGDWDPAAAPWSRNVVNRRIVRIRTVWRWAERLRLVPPGSWAGLCSLPGLRSNDGRVRHRKRQQPATQEQVDRITPHLPESVKPIFLVQWLTGMRSSEARTMRIEEIDMVSSIWIYRPTQHKNAWRGQERAIPLGPECQKIISPLIQSKKEGEIFTHPAKYGNKEGIYSVESYARAVSRAAKKAGLPGFHPYLLRHGAKDRLTKLYGLDAARAVLGQKSLGTTNEYGSSLDMTLAAKVMREIG